MCIYSLVDTLSVGFGHFVNFVGEKKQITYSFIASGTLLSLIYSDHCNMFFLVSLKAYCGFKGHENHEPDIATGKWGCGAFNGDPQLKGKLPQHQPAADLLLKIE